MANGTATVKQVRMCQECPFADEDEDVVYCDAEPTGRGLQDGNASKWPMGPPGWCPLRKRSVMVTFLEIEEALDA